MYIADASTAVGTIDRPAFLTVGGVPLTMGALIVNVYTTAVIFAGLILLAMLTISGIKWMTSGGDSKAKESAVGTMVNSIIGIIIVALAWSITVVLGRFLGIGSNILENLQITGPGGTP